MNRLTERDEYGNADIIGVDSEDLQLNLDFEGFNRVTEALNRLAAYEDTGLEPEEINCVNTNVYVNWRDDVFNDSGTEKLTIDSVGFMTHNGVFYAFNEIGKTVFLTREDAEKALEGMMEEEP